jgi:hypothetical protein
MRSNLINATRDEAMFAARAQLIGTSATYVKTHVLHRHITALNVISCLHTHSLLLVCLFRV